MAITEKVAKLLEQGGAKHQVMPHAEAFTSQEIAQSMHVTGRVLAKVVVVRERAGGHLMVVLPANSHVDLKLMGRETGREGLELATEDELRRLFPDCELGAMPPFGRLYGLPTYLDRCLTQVESLFFQAGNHHEVVRVDPKDYVRLAQPEAGDYCFHVPTVPV